MNRWTWTFVALLLAASTLPMLSSADKGLYSRNTNMDVQSAPHVRVTPVNP